MGQRRVEQMLFEVVAEIERQKPPARHEEGGAADLGSFRLRPQRVQKRGAVRLADPVAERPVQCHRQTGRQGASKRRDYRRSGAAKAAWPGSCRWRAVRASVPPAGAPSRSAPSRRQRHLPRAEGRCAPRRAPPPRPPVPRRQVAARGGAPVPAPACRWCHGSSSSRSGRRRADCTMAEYARSRGRAARRGSSSGSLAKAAASAGLGGGIGAHLRRGVGLPAAARLLPPRPAQQRLSGFHHAGRAEQARDPEQQGGAADHALVLALADDQIGADRLALRKMPAQQDLRPGRTDAHPRHFRRPHADELRQCRAADAFIVEDQRRRMSMGADQGSTGKHRPIHAQPEAARQSSSPRLPHDSPEAAACRVGIITLSTRPAARLLAAVAPRARAVEGGSLYRRGARWGRRRRSP